MHAYKHVFMYVYIISCDHKLWSPLPSKPEGRRKVGRSRLIWLKAAENDSQELKVKRWRQDTNDSEMWAFVVEDQESYRTTEPGSK
jgi:hypothetical protein